MKKNKKKIKKIRNIIILIVLAISIFLGIVYYITSRSDNYQNRLVKQVKKHYDIEEKISLINKYENNYIIITEDKVIVLNKKYKELVKENLSDLATNSKKYRLIYKNNKLMYEETILKKDKVTYSYYDAKTYEIIDTVVLED